MPIKSAKRYRHAQGHLSKGFRRGGHSVSAFSVLTLALLATSAAAQEAEDPLALLYGDEETVSIATGTKKPLRLAPSVASVITAEDIKAMGAQNLDEVLQTVPGVHVSVGRRYGSVVSIRGIHTNLNPHVLMLVNGFPITEAFTGGRIPTFRLPVHKIARVEIIRGPGSAVYGADAFAGVINIVTKGPSELPSIEVGATIGSHDTRGGWLQSSTEWAGWQVGLSLEKLASDGDADRIITRDLQSSFDDAFGSDASLAPGPASSNFDILSTHLQLTREHWHVHLDSWKQDKGGIGVGLSEALAPGYQDGEQHLFELGYSSEDRFDDWQLNARVNYFYQKQEGLYTILPPDTVLPIGSDGNLDPASPIGLVTFTDGLIGNPGGREETKAVELAAFYSGFYGHRLRFATGFKNQIGEAFEKKNFGPGVIDGTDPVVGGTLTEVTDTPFIYTLDPERDIKHVSIQDEWSILPDWELTTGVRYDSYSDFGDTINPRLALVWQTSYRLTSKFLYGRAFRAPSYSEQFAINNPVILGNQDLDPEQIDTIELSFAYQPSYDFHTRLNLFHYNVEGLIDFVDDDGLVGGSSTAQNTVDQHGHGFELEAKWEPAESVTVTGNYSRQRSEDEATGHRIPNAPGQLALLDVRWRLSPKWLWTTQWQHVADRKRSLGDERDEIADYNLVNLNLRADRVLPFLDLGFSIRNVFGEDAREPSVGPTPNIPDDHPLEGRRYMLEATFRISP